MQLSAPNKLPAWQIPLEYLETHFYLPVKYLCMCLCLVGPQGGAWGTGAGLVQGQEAGEGGGGSTAGWVVSAAF